VSLLERIHAVLEQQRIPYSLIGATAMAVHGVSRATQDVDVLTTAAAVLDETLWRDLREAGVEIDVRRGDADDPLLGVVRFREATQSVDIIVGRDDWQTEICRRARVNEVAGVRLPVADAADIVLLKLYAGGIQDRWDIVQLVAANPEIREIVDSRLRALPESLRTAWRRLTSEAS
jgi:hypothetical protein